MKGGSSNNSDVQQRQKVSEQTNENNAEENQEDKPDEKKTESDDASQKENEGDGKTEAGEAKEGGASESEDGETKTDGGELNTSKQGESEENLGETKQDDKVDTKIEEKVAENQEKKSESENETDTQDKNQVPIEVFPDGAHSKILSETTTQNGAWSTQAVESKNEKEAQQFSLTNGAYKWKICNVTAGSDYIPCIDNLQALKKLHSTKHYEHRERHCPEEAPTCLVSLPEGFRQSIELPTSREKIWYYNVPHMKHAEVKGHQNWVKVTGEYLTFLGGGTQFKNGALHYFDFIQDEP